MEQSNHGRFVLLLSAAAVLVGMAAAQARAGESGMDMGHAHHMAHMQQAQDAGAKRSTADYSLPDVNLVREDGKPVSLPKELDDGRPVFLTFIYTTCTTVCPVTTQTFAQLQEALGSDAKRVHMVSISIDPEQDTPARLREYSKRFAAGPEWQHYTGTVQASISAQRAFDVYRGDKMNHNPVTFVRSAPGQPWVRYDGFVSAKDLLLEYRRLVRG